MDGEDMAKPPQHDQVLLGNEYYLWEAAATVVMHHGGDRSAALQDAVACEGLKVAQRERERLGSPVGEPRGRRNGRDQQQRAARKAAMEATIRLRLDRTLSHGERMMRLARVARTLPMSWACDACEVLHLLSDKDLPLAADGDGLCDERHGQMTTAQTPADRAAAQMPQSGVGYRHVQVALNLARRAQEAAAQGLPDEALLSPDQTAYLTAMTQPYSVSGGKVAGGSDVTGGSNDDGDDDSVDNASTHDAAVPTTRSNNVVLFPRRDGRPGSFTPRIVAGADGRLRFMLRTITHLPVDVRHGDTEHVDGLDAYACAYARLGPVRVCPHERLNDSLRAWRAVAATEAMLSPVHGYVVETRSAWPLMVLARRAASTHFHAGMREAQRPVVWGVCNRCATEYALSATARSIEIRVWQDFGCEGLPADLVWRAHFNPKPPLPSFMSLDCLRQYFERPTLGTLSDLHSALSLLADDEATPIGDGATLTGDDAAQAFDDATQTDDTATQTDDTATQTDDTATQTDDTATQTDDKATQNDH